METHVLTADVSTTIAKAAKMMAERNVGSIIITQGKKPLGILTERDLLMKVVSEDLRPSKVKVEKIMSKPLITVTPDTDMVDAARTMASRKIRHLPVVENGRLVGILTASDITARSPELAEVVEVAEGSASESIGQSVCEACGELTTDLYEVNGKWVCENCRDSMSE
jgi:signal-transduction protein with cAMP-binding, CBS, and nucleotidyltransferase domain